MNWLLLLHIVALLFWVGMLVYLPLVLAPSSATSSAPSPETARNPPVESIERPEFARFLFTHLATPVALVAIIAGTWIFAVYQAIGVWLVVKLTLVVLLVANHILLGLLVIRAESSRYRFLRPGCWFSLFTTCVLATAVLWVVLAKPDFG